MSDIDVDVPKGPVSANIFVIIGLGALGFFVALYVWLNVAPTSDEFAIKRNADASDEIIMSWSGAVDAPMYRVLERAFEENKKGTKTIILQLDSPGGSISEGEMVIRTINRMKKTHRVITRVGPQANCLSMCVPIFLQGDERLASATSSFMFHRPFSVNPVTGEPTIEYAGAQNISEMRVYHNYFKNSVIDRAWRESMRKQWQRGDVWKTGRQLMRERSNIVSRLEVVDVATQTGDEI